MIEASRAMKEQARAARPARPLAGKTLAMIFDKPSTRTRVSFDVAMRQLGGESIMLTGQEMQLGRGETIADTARVLSRYVDAIMIRTLDHEALIELARTRHRAGDQRADPALASLPGDGRRDDLRGASRPDPRPHRRLDRRRQQRAGVLDACRRALRLPAEGRDAAGAQARRSGCSTGSRSSGAAIKLGSDPEEAVKGADCVVTDTWVSMGDKDGKRRHNLLKPYQVNARLMAQGQARRDLHALPARASRRGGHRRGDRRAAIGGVRRGREPPACPEGHPRLVPARCGAVTALFLRGSPFGRRFLHNAK